MSTKDLIKDFVQLNEAKNAEYPWVTTPEDYKRYSSKWKTPLEKLGNLAFGDSAFDKEWYKKRAAEKTQENWKSGQYGKGVPAEFAENPKMFGDVDQWRDIRNFNVNNSPEHTDLINSVKTVLAHASQAKGQTELYDYGLGSHSHSVRSATPKLMASLLVAKGAVPGGTVDNTHALDEVHLDENGKLVGKYADNHRGFRTVLAPFEGQGPLVDRKYPYNSLPTEDEE